MKLFKSYLISLLVIAFSFGGYASNNNSVKNLPDEGMWLPMFIKRLNYADMKKRGLKLKPEEIYDINNSSLKDAIVMLGGGFCTAEVVSNQGLLFTNHHCAYDLLQSHSTVEKDYLKNGFWAMSKKEELPNEGLTASFLVRMEDVTSRVLADVGDDASEQERMEKIKGVMKTIEEEATEGNDYEANVKSFYEGNEFYLFVYKTYKDVRLVGAPPESIGKYGGDTDNWMWPRHTGDFAMLRIYTDAQGNSAEYSADNIPLKPKKHLKVSLDGVEKGDYAMIMGFPGSTDRYLTSHGIEMALDESYPTRVKIRGAKLDIMKQGMDADPKVRLQYASKYARISNYWKYFIGQSEGLERLNVRAKKKKQEDALLNWINADSKRKEKYGNPFETIEEGYEKLAEVNKGYLYYAEAIYFGAEVLGFSNSFSNLLNLLKAEEKDERKIAKEVESLRKATEDHFKDYNLQVDKNMLKEMLKMYYSGVPLDQQPALFETIRKDYNIDFGRYTDHVFSSIFSSEGKTKSFLDAPSAEKIENDPAFMAVQDFRASFFGSILPKRAEANALITEGKRKMIAAMREMMPNKKFAPDANSTLRLTYGNVLDYFPQDAVYYSYYTTAEGILAKEDPENPEFIVDEKLKKLIEAKDFGRYGQDGVLMVGFISNNDITGGNSGSPVMNARGELIGIAFDGNWEAMSGDIAFEPELQRTISVDIRYVLFCIDKLGGAKHLVDEMTLIQRNKNPRKPSHRVIFETN